MSHEQEDARRRDIYFDLQDDDNLPPGHTYENYEDEYTSHCECGKWVEPGTWDIWNHINDVLRELAAAGTPHPLHPQEGKDA